MEAHGTNGTDWTKRVGSLTAADVLPFNEAERMAALRRYEILDTPADGTFDRITALAARVLNVPIAIVSVVDHDRIWFKSKHGLESVTQIDREPGLCASAILQDEPWLVRDAAIDPRTLTNSLVAGDFGLRFYAGVPLRTFDGFNLGTLCVLDTEPRGITADEVATLEDLAAMVIQELELRLASIQTVTAESKLRKDAEKLADTLQASLLPPVPPSIGGLDLATRFVPGERHLHVGGDFLDVFPIGEAAWGLVIGDACGKGPRAASTAALARWSVRAAAALHRCPNEVMAHTNGVLQAEGDGDDHFCTMAFAHLTSGDAVRVRLACGGHPLPMLVSASGAVEARGHPGNPIGMFPHPETVEDAFDVGPGDALVFYTDGITEARARSGEQFGTERLEAVLRATAARSAATIADAVVDAAQAFGDSVITDDVAVLVLRRHPAGSLE